MKYIVFIDGREGTTGLQIEARMRARADIELLTAPEDRRKDPACRAECINAADAVFLCLPDEAAAESARLCTNPKTVLIDASTAHRTAPGWVYGLPELSPAHRQAVRGAKRVANPGCHATGFIAAVYPLVRGGRIAPDAPLCCYSLTGYSGGGKKMIAQYEAAERPAALAAPRPYGLAQAHKHLPEMQAVCGLASPPVFCPVVGDFYSGMAVSVLLPPQLLRRGENADSLLRYLAEYYADEPLFEVAAQPADGFLAANELAGRPGLRLYVCGGERVTITAVFDNLYKGAAGAAVQNMNLALGLPEYTGILGGQAGQEKGYGE